MRLGQKMAPHRGHVVYIGLQIQKEMQFSQFLNLSSKITYFESYLNIIIILCASFFIFENQTKNMPLKMTIHEIVHCTCSTAIYCMCYLYLILIYGHNDCLKVLNEMQHTSSDTT